MKLVTLQIKKPFGENIWTVLLLLTVLIGVAEWVTRLEIFQSHLTPPKLTSRHYQLGHKLALLDAEIRTNGPIDCIMVGSSMVDVGFNPDFFQFGYYRVANKNIRCFNFGIDASSAVSTAALVSILIEDYHPRLLIIGTDPRDYVLPLDDDDVTTIMDSPWMRYRLEDFSLDGWLTEISYLYRYRQHLNRLIRFNFKDTLWSDTKLNYPILPNGYTPFDTVNLKVEFPPDPQDTSYEVTYYSRIYFSYEMLDVNLKALEEIMEYNEKGIQVILVEMPVSDGLYYFFGNGEEDYDKFVARVSELADLHQVPFWRTEPLDFISNNGWSDYSHLNVKGAEIFSLWLGEQVGRLDATVR